MENKVCPHCNNSLPDEASFCPQCMKKLLQEKALSTMPAYSRKKRVALIAGIVALLIIITSVSFYFVASNNRNVPNPTSICVWTMKLRPNGGADSFNYCLTNNYIGFGWGLDGTPATITEYRKLREQENAYPGDTELDRTLENFENITSGDNRYVHLLWTVSPSGEYYICEATGAYQYSRDAEHEAAGIVNFTDCNFYHIGGDLVPQAIIDDFNEDGVIHIIGGTDVIETTKQLWQIAKDK